MGILNITPCKNIVNTRGQEAQVAAHVDTKSAINISADSTGTAFPKMEGGNNAADFYRIVADTDMYVRFGESADDAGSVEIGNTVFTASIPEYTGRISYLTHVAKLDK